jgi:hypothetical protein
VHADANLANSGLVEGGAAEERSTTCRHACGVVRPCRTPPFSWIPSVRRAYFMLFCHVLGIFLPSLWETKQGMRLRLLLTLVLACCALACRHMIAVSLSLHTCSHPFLCLRAYFCWSLLVLLLSSLSISFDLLLACELTRLSFVPLGRFPLVSRESS